jgi:hypothetical protein
MVDNAVAPRRGESVVDANGIPTLRFMRYLEQVSTQSNETIPDTEIDSASINLSIGLIGSLAQKLADLEIELGIVPAEPGRV